MELYNGPTTFADLHNSAHRLAFLLPESPAWLLQKSRMNKAYDAFRKLHGAKGTAANQDLYSDMQKAVNDERYAAQDRTATYLECFRRANRRRTLIVVFANMIPELFGLTLLGVSKVLDKNVSRFNCTAHGPADPLKAARDTMRLFETFADLSILLS